MGKLKIMYQIPLSPYSRIFHTEWKLDPSRTDYNIVFDNDIEGNINIALLNTAIKRIITDYIILNSHVREQLESLFWVQNENIGELEYFKNKLSDKDIISYIQKPF